LSFGQILVKKPLLQEPLSPEHDAGSEQFTTGAVPGGPSEIMIGPEGVADAAACGGVSAGACCITKITFPEVRAAAT
jgi:hypothetical protein